MTRRDVYIVAAARTAVGSFGGALKDIPPTSLAEITMRAVLARGRSQ